VKPKPNPRGLCVLTPIADGHERELRTHLRELPAGLRSPMIRVHGTHYARWTIVHLEGRDGKPLPAKARPLFLLFSSEFDGELEPYVARLCSRLGRDAHDIWRHCTGYPGGGDDALARFLLDHHMRPGYSVIAYPDAGVDDVRAAFAMRERLNDFLVRTRGLDSAALQRAWIQRFRGGDR
jgi:hypothetical protein